MSKSLRSFTKNERPWVIRSGRSEGMSNHEQIAQIAHQKWANEPIAHFLEHISSFAHGKKRAIRSKNRWANFQPCSYLGPRSVNLLYLSMWLMINCHPYLGPSKDHWGHDWSLGGRGPTRHHTGDAGEGDPFAQTHHHPVKMINPILHNVLSYWRYRGKVTRSHRPITTLQWWLTLYYTLCHHTEGTKGRWPLHTDPLPPCNDE